MGKIKEFLRKNGITPGLFISVFISVLIASGSKKTLLELFYGLSGKVSTKDQITSIYEKTNTIYDELLKDKSIAIEPFVDAQQLKTTYTKSLDLFTERQYDASISKLQSILKDSSFKSNNKANSAYVYYWLGENYFAKGNYDKALDYFRNKLSEERHNFYLSAQKKLAIIYMTGKCYEKKYWDSEPKDDKIKMEAIKYYEQLEQESKYNYCQPIFEYARKTLKKLKRAR